MVSRLRRKSRAYRFGLSYCSGTRRNYKSPVKEDVLYSDWLAKLRLVRIDGFGFGGEFTLKIGFKLSQPQVLACGRLASEGAEKSCRSKRRRKRGLRRGKSRSRGRHPRRSSPQAATVPKSSLRAVLHHLRMLDWNKRVADNFGKLLRYSYMEGRFDPGSNPRILYARFSGMWSRKRDMILAKGGVKFKPSVDSCFCFTFADFVRVWCNARVAVLKGESNPQNDFSSLLGSLRKNHELPTPGKKPRGTFDGRRGSTGQRQLGGNVHRMGGRGGSVNADAQPHPIYRGRRS